MARSKALSFQDIRANVDRFVTEWKDETAEQAESQSFWNDFLGCFGVDRRRCSTFERKATRSSTSNTGRIDIFWPGVMIGEQKSAGILTRDEEIAEIQAEDYLLGGDISKNEYPRYIVTCDFQKIRLTDLESEDDNRTLTIDLTSLSDHVEDFAWIAGYEARKFSTEEEEAASVKAATIMAKLFVALVGDQDFDEVTNPDDEDEQALGASILLTRILFLLFGDDAGLWERGLFEHFIEERTSEDGSDLGSQLTSLFEVLNTSEERRSKRTDEFLLSFPYVNGDLFAEGQPTMFFDRELRDALLVASHFDWTSISPAVFGSLFQAIKSKSARRADGEHYTNEANILKTIEPLFLDEVRSKVKKAWNSSKNLRNVHDSFEQMRYLDPACGSGNFLIVAYREMRTLELEVLLRLRELDKNRGQMSIKGEEELKVSLDQFYGIELNWWPAKIAEVAMFLADHQANREMALKLGQAPNRLPIAIAPKIHQGNALRTDWKELVAPTPATFVFGNPPFAGQKEKTDEQQEDLDLAWGHKCDGYLDYVTGWHAMSSKFFGEINGRWAFVSTNSITQGQPVAALFNPLSDAGWHIQFAHRTFEWTSEATGKAAVHCVIIGFSRSQESKKQIFDYASVKSDPHEVTVSNINPYLIDGPNVLINKRTTDTISPCLSEIQSGSKAVDWGFYTIKERAEYEQLLKDPIAAKFLRPYLGGEEMINGIERWCLWLEGASAADISASLELKERVQEVQKRRESSKRTATNLAATTPHLFGERRQPSVPYLGIPQTFSEGRRWATAERLETDTIASIKLFTASDEDGFLFSIICSSMFITWQKTVGGRLKSDPSFSNTIVWNNLPLPAVTAKTREKIIAAGETILQARSAHPERTLAEHYNPLAMQPNLVTAHTKLDAIVDKAFGATKTLKTERERQTILFKRYLELTEKPNGTGENASLDE